MFRGCHRLGIRPIPVLLGIRIDAHDQQSEQIQSHKCKSQRPGRDPHCRKRKALRVRHLLTYCSQLNNIAEYGIHAQRIERIIADQPFRTPPYVMQTPCTHGKAGQKSSINQADRQEQPYDGNNGPTERLTLKSHPADADSCTIRQDYQQGVHRHEPPELAPPRPAAKIHIIAHAHEPPFHVNRGLGADR